MSIRASVARSVELVLKGTKRRIDLRVTDTDGELVDPTELSIVITRSGDSIVYEDDFYDPPAVPGVTRIVRVSQGVYYFPLGDQTLFPLEVGGPANMETASAQKLAVTWHVALGTGESADPVQVVQVVTTTTLMRVQQLRLRVDKAAKDIDEDPDDPCYLGYTDAMLVDFLSGGLGIINGLQPQVGWLSIDSFPEMHERVLLDAAIIDTLTSQEVFAVDTDTLNFSDQGNSFNLDHQTRLSSILTATWTRFVPTAVAMKKQYLRSGTVRVDFPLNARFQQLVASAPSGAFFRGFHGVM